MRATPRARERILHVPFIAPETGFDPAQVSDIAADPAFRGRRRELVAADYAYAFNRFFDPATKSAGYARLSAEGIVGLEALRLRAVREGKPFDYEAEVEGLRALDS